MKIKKIQYNITNIAYSVYYKNRQYKRVMITCYSYNCLKINLVVITKSYWKYSHLIYTHYVLKPLEINNSKSE